MYVCMYFSLSLSLFLFIYIHTQAPAAVQPAREAHRDERHAAGAPLRGLLRVRRGPAGHPADGWPAGALLIISIYLYYYYYYYCYYYL